MRRGKVLGTRAKKEGWEGEKRKINAPTLLTRLDHCALFPVLPLSVLLHVQSCKSSITSDIEEIVIISRRELLFCSYWLEYSRFVRVSLMSGHLCLD